MRLTKGLKEDRLLSRIMRLNRKSGLCLRALAFYLLDFEERGLFKRQGCSSTAQYAYVKMQIPVKKTRELLRVARALEGVPLIDESFAKGEISWCAVRELTRVAVKETEAEWLDLAKIGTLRKVEFAVSRAKRGESPPKNTYGLSTTTLKVVAELSLEDYALWEAAFERAADRMEGEADASKVLAHLAKSFLESPLEKGEKEMRKAYQIIYHQCSECDRTWIETADGPAEVQPGKVERIGEVADKVRLKEEPRGPRGSCDSKTDRYAPRGAREEAGKPVPVKERDKPNTRRIRREVLSRDGQRCAVPGCRNRGYLMAHHVEHRKHGGRTELANEICVCRTCHGLIHEGLLKVEGAAPYGLRWSNAEGTVLEWFAGGRRTGKPGYSKDAADVSDAPRGASMTDYTVYNLEEVPDVITPEWWKKHRHNFFFKGNRMYLKKAR